MKRDRVPFSKGLSTVIVDKSFDLTVNAFFGLLGVILVLVNIALPSNTLIILTVLSIVAFSFIFSFYFQLMKGKGFFTKLFRILRLHKAKLLKDHEKKLEEIEREVIHFFTNNRKDFITAFLISLLLWFLMFMEYKVVLLIFGYDASPVDIFLAFFMVGVAYIVPIPGALGVLEFGETSLFSVIATKGVGFAMSLIIRAKDIILTCIGLLFLFYFHIKLKDIPKK